MKLAKHELWHCFLEGASHVLCKAGTLIDLLKSTPQRAKNEGHKDLALKRAHVT